MERGLDTQKLSYLKEKRGEKLKMLCTENQMKYWRK